MKVEKSVKCVFVVDGKKYDMNDTSTNGRNIKTIAEVPGEYALFLEEDGDQPDRQISDRETIDLTGEMKCFYAVPPATFGSSGKHVACA